MESGFKSTLPMFADKLQVWRTWTQHPCHDVPLFYSLTLHERRNFVRSINMTVVWLFFDRFSLENVPNSVILVSLEGRKFLVKLEAMRQLIIGTDIIIIDPENEYEQMCKHVWW